MKERKIVEYREVLIFVILDYNIRILYGILKSKTDLNLSSSGSTGKVILTSKNL